MHAKKSADERFLEVLRPYNLPYLELPTTPFKSNKKKLEKRKETKEVNRKIQKSNIRFLEHPSTFYIAQFFFMAEVGGLKDHDKLMNVICAHDELADQEEAGLRTNIDIERQQPKIKRFLTLKTRSLTRSTHKLFDIQEYFPESFVLQRTHLRYFLSGTYVRRTIEDAIDDCIDRNLVIEHALPKKLASAKGIESPVLQSNGVLEEAIRSYLEALSVLGYPESNG